MKTLAAVALGCCFAVVCPAAEPITIGERVTIQSKILGEERTILISTPANYARSTERYPVLYMTDGDAHLTHTRGTVDFLSRNGLMPDLIIVGVVNTDRTRDLSPTHWVRPAEPGEPPPGPNTSGGADKFLDFFAKELFPYVESHYRTSPYRIFAGHSLGGLLALHIMVARPDLFNAYIAASPALNWDDDYPLRTTKAFFKDRKVFHKTLFVAMANEEAGEPKPTKLRPAVRHTGRRQGGRFRLGLHAHGGRDPRLRGPALPLLGPPQDLRRVEAPRWTRRPAASRAPWQTSRSHYAALGKRMGIPLLPPEQTVNLLGYQFLQGGSGEQAIAVFRYNVELYPDSANVYDSLGEALERRRANWRRPSPTTARPWRRPRSQGQPARDLHQEPGPRRSRRQGHEEERPEEQGSTQLLRRGRCQSWPKGAACSWSPRRPPRGCASGPRMGPWISARTAGS